MMRYLLFVIFIAGFFIRSAGIDNFRAGGRSLALSDASVSFSDLWSTFNNQAGTSGPEYITAGVFYKSGFFLKELSTIAGAFILPVKSGNFSLSFIQFGRNSYKEEKIGLAFAKKLGNQFRAGIQFDYFMLYLPENERVKGFATFEGGIIYAPEDHLAIGMHLFNPVGAGIQYLTGKESVPATFRLGGHYRFNESLMVCLEGEKRPVQPVSLRTGIEYVFLDALSVRFGMSGNPFRYTAGIGYRTGKLLVDIGFSYHNSLGMTPSVSLQYSFR